MLRKFFALIFLSIAVTAGAQSMKARWGLTLALGESETLVSRKGGGVFLSGSSFAGGPIKAFSADGVLEWTLPSPGPDSAWTVAADGTVLQVDRVLTPTADFRVRRYDDAGQLVDTKQFPLAPYIDGKALGISANAQGIVIFATLANDGSCVFYRLDQNLNVAFSKTVSGQVGLTSRVQILDDGYVYSQSTIANNQASVRKFTPGGTLVWDKNVNGTGKLVAISGGRAFGGYSWSGGGSSGCSGMILDAAGSQAFIGSGLGSFASRENGQIYLYSGFDGMTNRASITKVLYTGILSWTRDFGFDGSAVVDGTDQWGNVYAMTTSGTGGKRLYKVNQFGNVVWYRTGGVDSAVSPHNQDVFLMDKLSNRYRLFCFQQAPIGTPDTYTTPNTGQLIVNVGLNDKYVVDSTFSIDSPPTQGTATITPDGILTYTPPAGFVGNVTLRYRAAKAGLTPAGNVLVNINVTN